MIDMQAEDLNRTYRGTYLGLRTDDGVEPIEILDCESRNQLRYRDRDGEVNSIDINHPTVYLPFPDSGVYTLNRNRAVYVQRRAQRQWHRGIRAEAVRLIGDGTFNRDLVTAMYNPTYMGWAVVQRLLQDDNFKSAAINRNIWVRKQRGMQYSTIHFRDRCIGEIREEGSVFVSDVMKDLFEEACSENP